MYTFAYPWLLLLLLVPLTVPYLLKPYQEEGPAIRTPWFKRIVTLFQVEAGQETTVRKRARYEYLLNALLVVGVVVALARPQYIEPPVTRIVPTRDVLLIVDLSGSMEAVDFTDPHGVKTDRLTAVKSVLDDFLEKRAGDRVGLIVFGNAPYVQVPFTQDLEACRILLSETASRMAGPRTAFGDAIGLGITLFERSEVQDKLMIALTDGNDTGSKVAPREAARIARDEGVVIHVVGVGDPASVGEEQLDEEVLRAVASTSGGRYFFAADRAQLNEVYLEIDKIESREVESYSYRPRNDLFHWPLGAVLVGSLAMYCFRLLAALIPARQGGQDG